MKRVQLQFSEEQMRALHERAVETGQAVAAVVREAVDRWMLDYERTKGIDRALAALGGFHSGLGDLAEAHDRYLDDDG